MLFAVWGEMQWSEGNIFFTYDTLPVHVPVSLRPVLPNCTICFIYFISSRKEAKAWLFNEESSVSVVSRSFDVWVRRLVQIRLQCFPIRILHLHLHLCL